MPARTVERWGRGNQKTVELCLRAGHPEPQFTEVAVVEVGAHHSPKIFLWGMSRKIVLNSTIYINPTGVSEASRIANPVAIASCRSESLSRGSFRQGAERRSSRSSFRLLHHWQLQPKRTRHGYKSGFATGVVASVALSPNFRQAFSRVSSSAPL